MGSIRKNDNKSFPHVQDQFIGEVGKLFDAEHPGHKCPNTVFIRVLFCALCHIQSLFVVCRNTMKTKFLAETAKAAEGVLCELRVLCEKKNQNGKHGRKAFTFAYYGVEANQARWMFETYLWNAVTFFQMYLTFCKFDLCLKLQ